MYVLSLGAARWLGELRDRRRSLLAHLCRPCDRVLVVVDETNGISRTARYCETERIVSAFSLAIRPGLLSRSLLRRAPFRSVERGEPQWDKLLLRYRNRYPIYQFHYLSHCVSCTIQHFIKRTKLFVSLFIYTFFGFR